MSVSGTTKGGPISNTLLDLNRIDELSTTAIEDGDLVMGARASWTDIIETIREKLPEFRQIISVFGSPQIRNVGTIGGNIINASPIADSAPLLFACDAKLELSSVSGTRTVAINDFYQGYKKFDLRPGELLTSVRVTLPAEDELLRLYKVSRRKDMDISTFTAAIRMKLDGDTIASASIAYGAVGPVVVRLPKTESFLVGKPDIARHDAICWRRGRFRNHSDHRRPRRSGLSIAARKKRVG